jgi:hypothetical protein
LEENLLKIPKAFCKKLPQKIASPFWPKNVGYGLSKLNSKEIAFYCGEVISVELEYAPCKGTNCKLTIPGYCTPKFSYNTYTGKFKYLGKGEKCFFAWQNLMNSEENPLEGGREIASDYYSEVLEEFNSKEMFWYYSE